MMPYPDAAVFDWIKHGRKKANPPDMSDPSSWEGCSVGHLMPSYFEAYVKVFHWLDAHYESIDNPLSRAELATLKIPDCIPLRDFVEKVRANRKETRVRWREVAEALHVPFISRLSDNWFRDRLEPGCWPRYIYGPGEGYLDPAEWTELSTLMAGKIPRKGVSACYRN